MAKLKEIGIRLREVRKRLNLTQEKLARLSGVTFPLISAAENGKKRISSPVLFALAELSVNINFIITGKGDMFLKDNCASDLSTIDFGDDAQNIEELIKYVTFSPSARYHLISALYVFKRDNIKIVKELGAIK